MDLDFQTVMAQLNGSLADSVAALQSLKNDMIGDIQKKMLWVRHGLLPRIVSLLLSNPSKTHANGKGTRLPFSAPKTFTDDELARLQALQLLASIATGMLLVSTSPVDKLS